MWIKQLKNGYQYGYLNSRRQFDGTKYPQGYIGNESGSSLPKHDKRGMRKHGMAKIEGTTYE